MDNVSRCERERMLSPPAAGLTTNHHLVQLSAAAHIKTKEESVKITFAVTNVYF